MIMLCMITFAIIVITVVVQCQGFELAITLVTRRGIAFGAIPDNIIPLTPRVGSSIV